MFGKHQEDANYISRSILQPLLGCLGIIAVVLVLIGFVYAFVSFDAWECQRRAEAMGLNWMYDPRGGCYVQQPNGSWMPIDSNNNYVVP